MKTETILVRVTPEMKQQLEKIADLDRRPLSDYLRLMFEKTITNENEKITKRSKSHWWY